ncbi:MAG: thioredoxin family protein [Bacteroidetes bacterium]|jgi:thiol-disulfide isomerase/thioredoxin|nr:thioredoxin family protein [Bacteroidota bacterium]
MNKNYLIFFTLIMITLNGFSQNLNIVITDPVRNREVLVDLLDRNGLQTGEMGVNYSDFYDGYESKSEVIEKLKSLVDDIHITIVLATWCGDSKQQVPAFLKVLDQTGFSNDNLLMIGVDFEKKAREIDVDVFNISRVPTFIFHRNEIEIGRITETPIETLEEDFLKIALDSKD